MTKRIPVIIKTTGYMSELGVIGPFIKPVNMKIEDVEKLIVNNRAVYTEDGKTKITAEYIESIKTDKKEKKDDDIKDTAVDTKNNQKKSDGHKEKKEKSGNK